MLCTTCNVEIGSAASCPSCAVPNTHSPQAPKAPAQTSNDQANQNPAATDEPTTTEPNQKAPNKPDSIGNKARHLTLRDQILSNYFGDTYNITQKGKDHAEEASFSQVTRKLTPRAPSTQAFAPEEVAVHSADLRGRHLILIACAEGDFALDAVHALIGKLRISEPEHKVEIDLKEQLDKNFKISFKSFLPEKQQAKTAILVYAPDDSAQGVIEALISDSFRSQSFESHLKDHGVYLLCVVQPRYIDERLSDEGRELKVPYWKLPFLRPMLKQTFRDAKECAHFEKTVLRQRREGRWDRDETKFHGEIKTLLRRGLLVKMIEERDKPVDVNFAKSIFQDDDYIAKAVLYAATYFRDLTAKEFCTLVESLLGDRKVPEYRRNENEAVELVHTRTEVAARQLWDDNKDKIMWERLCETSSGDGTANVIDFSDPRSRDSLKAFFEGSRSFLIKDNFYKIQNQGFLFYPSDRMAENMIRLTLEMITAYPDEFSKQWLVELVIKVRESHEIARNSAGQPIDHVVRFLRITTADALAQAYSRIAEVMHRLLKNHGMKDMVDRCLGELIRLGFHDSVLGLVKRLGTAPEIDEFDWVKQLLDQGDIPTRLKTYDYFYKRIRRQGPSILEAHKILEDWLPTDGREADRYPRSSRYALRSLLQYCLESVDQLEQKSYGAWPTPYPLFAFGDKQAAEEGLNRLIGWLFHPAMQNALEQFDEDFDRSRTERDEPNTLIGALIAEWFFILLGPPQNAPLALPSGNGKEPAGGRAETRSLENNGSGLDAAALVKIILQQTARIADKEQQKDLIDYWELLSEDMSHLMKFSKLSADQRTQLVWKKNRLWELLKSFRQMRSQAPLAAGKSGERG